MKQERLGVFPGIRSKVYPGSTRSPWGTGVKSAVLYAVLTPWCGGEAYMDSDGLHGLEDGHRSFLESKRIFVSKLKEKKRKWLPHYQQLPILYHHWSVARKWVNALLALARTVMLRIEQTRSPWQSKLNWAIKGSNCFCLTSDRMPIGGKQVLPAMGGQRISPCLHGQILLTVWITHKVKCYICGSWADRCVCSGMQFALWPRA